MISTKDIKDSGNVSKTLLPGNHKVTVLNLKLNRPPYTETGYELHINVVGADLGDKFEGFYIDKNNTSLGRYKGQIGRIKASKWLFQDRTFGEMKFSRDLEILKFVKKLCSALDCEKWFDDQDNKHETIEDFISQINIDKPFEDKELYTCIAGREYENKQGYINFDLYFPKFSKAGVPFEKYNSDLTKSRVFIFNEAEHIQRTEKKSEEKVDGFEPTNETSGFELG